MDFPRERRLCSSEFGEVLKKGKRAASAHLVFVVLKTGSGEKKVGWSLSRKVGGAVLRNKIKRWLREFFRLHQHSLVPGFRLVILVKTGHRLANYHDVESCCLSLLRQSGLLSQTK